MTIPSVISVEQIGPYRLRLRFDDGAEGEIDVQSTTTFEGVFEPLNDPGFFSQVRVDEDDGIAYPLDDTVTRPGVACPSPDSNRRLSTVLQRWIR